MRTDERPLPLASKDETRGLLMGFLGVAIFAATLPMTRLAVAELDAAFVGIGRAVLAGLLALAWLGATRAPLPARGQVGTLVLVAAGVVLGFPLFSSLALRDAPASHAAVINGLLPLGTALMAAWRGGERPSPAFWGCAVAGSALVVGFALAQGGGGLGGSDWLMLCAVAAGSLGYAEGGRLATVMGGPRVICWALVVALPLTLPVTVWLGWSRGLAASPAAWASFAYVGVFSMFLGFFAWYRGLALGGVARVGQVQLVQPFLTLAIAALIGGEAIGPVTWLVAVAVVGVIALGRRTRVARSAVARPAEPSTRAPAAG
ncbi:DMT family transporter [Arenibaculum pallidiluteum]|uniref:DMT family transporter n=1 Tax=Arenibaculum pallidiluteum TaxID=2812559 RepID=UPI001F1D1BB2|nr:DMT family transporter [Arenibaculum pallidiluteum]